MIKISTKDMSHDEWLQARNKSIGGSDAAAVLGLSKYKSPFALWAEKTGKVIPEDISDKEAVRLGNDLEQYVADRWMEATGKKVRRENNILINEEYPFAHANIDRAVIGEHAGLECKTTSDWNKVKQLRAGEVPPEWYCQCCHYLAVTGAERWYLACVAFGAGFFCFTIERNQAEVDALVAAESDFWELVTSNTQPALDGSESSQEAVKAMYPDSSDRQIDLTGLAASILTVELLQQRIKEAETTMEKHKSLICNAMQDADKGIYGDYTVSWKTQVRSTFDRKKWEKDHGQIPDQYFKKSTFRPFKLSKKEN